MQVNGTDSKSVSPASINAAQVNDPVSKSLEQQIQKLKEQQKELSANQDMPMEMKSKKRQELQKQISQLEMELRQHQVDVKREEARKRKEKSQSLEEMTGTKPSGNVQNGHGAGLSQSIMQAMITADSAMVQADVQGSVASRMEDRAGVLESEIKLDQSRGMDTAAKEEALAKTRKTAQKAAADQIGSLAEAGGELQEASEEEAVRNPQEEEPGEEESSKAQEEESYYHAVDVRI